MVAPTRLSLRLALDFLTEGSRVEAMTKSEDENPRSRHLEDLMLSAIWTRLEQAGEAYRKFDAQNSGKGVILPN